MGTRQTDIFDDTGPHELAELVALLVEDAGIGSAVVVDADALADRIEAIVAEDGKSLLALRLLCGVAAMYEEAR